MFGSHSLPLLPRLFHDSLKPPRNASPNFTAFSSFSYPMLYTCCCLCNPGVTPSPREFQPNSNYTFKQKWLSLSQNLSAIDGSSVLGGGLWLPPYSTVGWCWLDFDRSCEVSHGCCEVASAIVLQCPEDTAPTQLSLMSTSYILSTSSFGNVSESWSQDLT